MTDKQLRAKAACAKWDASERGKAYRRQNWLETKADPVALAHFKEIRMASKRRRKALTGSYQ